MKLSSFRFIAYMMLSLTASNTFAMRMRTEIEKATKAEINNFFNITNEAQRNTVASKINKEH